MLNKLLKHPLLQLLFFWLILFTAMRGLFLLVYIKGENENYIPNSVLSFFYGLRMDLSATGYLLVLPFLFWLTMLITQKTYEKTIHYINYFFILLVVGICISNIALYGTWRSTINYRALTYLLYPSELIAFAGFKLIALGISGVLVFTYLFIKLYNKQSVSIEKNVKRIWLHFAIIIVCLFTLIRGGFQLTPINESAAIFSTTPFYNNVATNPVWYLTNSVATSIQSKNVYTSMSDERANAIFKKLHTTSTIHSQIIKTPKPNIVFIILESWTAGIIESLEGEKGVTPKFNKLCKDGLLFSEAYGSGYRTDVGLAAILSGYPGLPNNSVITISSKANTLPCLAKDLSELGYKNSFFYGGDIEFANMKNYLVIGGFKTIVDKNNFDNEQQNSKWGAHDEYVFKKNLASLYQESQPFFSTVLTLSSHEPFEVPAQSNFTGSDDQSKFFNAVHYTDECLYNYLSEAKKQPWYDNTLFILCADHGRYVEGSISANSPVSKRITFMITGGALADTLRGKTVDYPVAQHDIASTILNQLGINKTDYLFSRDIFNAAYNPFAYYANENVLGWIVPNAKKTYPHTDPLSEKDSNETNAKAYLQILYQDFIDR